MIRARVELASLKTLRVNGIPDDVVGEYEVEYCGVCRTDAKMYFEGQRDLVLPRVPGHEAVFRHVASGKRYGAWPAKSCGTCEYCSSGRENLCETIRIMGFHFDGGYSSACDVRGLDLIELGSSISPWLYSFAEPVGCALNAFRRLDRPVEGDGILIHGAGTLGLIAAFVARRMGLAVTMLERNEEKLRNVAAICEGLGARAKKSLDDGNFGVCLNACADYVAFCTAVTKLKRGGTLLFFSGITKNENVTTNLANLIHYKELEIRGAYGLARRDYAEAIPVIESDPDFFASLVQGFARPEEIGETLAEVMTGMPLKYILDFTGSRQSNRAASAVASSVVRAARTEPGFTVPEIAPVDEALKARARFLLDDKAKPLGSLGKLEDLAVWLCAAQGTLQPRVDSKLMLVFAGDHGIVEEGVSAYPREVTAQMALNFKSGKAAINVFCRQYGIDLNVVDMGIDADLPYDETVLNRKVRRGTTNFAVSDAMMEVEALEALENGMAVFGEMHARKPVDILGLGEMGIGNSSSAALVISYATGIPSEELVGRGTGVDDAGLEHKAKVLLKAHALHSDGARDGVSILRQVGGFEIAGMAGAALAAASKRVPVVLDGVISTAAGLIAFLIEPKVADYFVVGHKSVERAQAAACRLMGLEPLVDLSMRLGEGTGAAVSINLAELAARLIREMATFEEARISGRSSVRSVPRG